MTRTDYQIKVNFLPQFPHGRVPEPASFHDWYEYRFEAGFFVVTPGDTRSVVAYPVGGIHSIEIIDADLESEDH